MRIKYLTGPRSGQIDHAPNSQEIQLLIKAGILEEIPYKDFRERLADTMPQAPAPLVQWAVHEKAAGGAVVVKTVNGGDVNYYDAPPVGCPQQIIDRFNYLCRLVAEYGAGKAETERLEREQHSLKDKVAAGLGRILYGGK